MAYYQDNARPDQAKAIVAVIAVHVLLALVILTGLNVKMIGETVERLQTFNVIDVPPPPPVKPPPPEPQPHQAPKAQGAPAPKAEPTPVVAPKPVLPVPSPIPAAKIAGTGNAASAGAASAGNGTGAGGRGSGLGGGGSTAGFTPARRISKIPNSEYRRLSSQGLPNGGVVITVLVNPDGRPSNCRVTRSSGNPYSDSMMCQLTEAYVRFDPARDASGRPIGEDVTYYQNWWRP